MAKMNAFQMLTQSGTGAGQVSLKLKKEESQSIVESVHKEVIQGQLAQLEGKVQREIDAQRKTEDNSDEEDPQMQSFLNAIDLGDDEEELKAMDEELDEPETDQNKPWSLLYHAFSCIERLLEHQDKKSVTAVINAPVRLATTSLRFSHALYNS